jgi:phosphotransferase system HPr (HPr) family protein
MTTVDAVFRDRYGLHPRAAMRIQQTAAGFGSAITIEGLDSSTAAVSASSMIGLVSAGIRAGERIRIVADGQDEAVAAEAMRALCDAGVCHP